MKTISLYRKHLFSRCFLLITTILASVSLTATAVAQTPVASHGQLQVSGNRIVDQLHQPVSLAGPSFFWSNTGWKAERYYNADVVKHLRSDWRAGIIRAAIGVEGNGGYLEDPTANLARAKALIDAAIAEGLYVIVDWHSHHAEQHPEKAIGFFAQIATLYGHHPNIIYEIYNEPLRNTSWKRKIKPYALSVISVIREIDPDNLIIVGTQSWSQDVDKAAKSPIEGFDNIAYTLHFYAGTHKESLRKKARYALDKGLALVVTEWGTVNANGDGEIDRESVDQWLTFMRENQLSHCNWALNDKPEGASMLVPDTLPDGNWNESDLTDSGRLVRSIIQNW